jgi:hypothetical protein
MQDWNVSSSSLAKSCDFASTFISPEIGGLTTRVRIDGSLTTMRSPLKFSQEIKKILQGLDGLKVVGADIVEVAPAYDTQGESSNWSDLQFSHPVTQPRSRPSQPPTSGGICSPLWRRTLSSSEASAIDNSILPRVEYKYIYSHTTVLQVSSIPIPTIH